MDRAELKVQITEDMNAHEVYLRDITIERPVV
jgi:hypothetical protein